MTATFVLTMLGIVRVDAEGRRAAGPLLVGLLGLLLFWFVFEGDVGTWIMD